MVYFVVILHFKAGSLFIDSQALSEGMDSFVLMMFINNTLEKPIERLNLPILIVVAYRLTRFLE